MHEITEKIINYTKAKHTYKKWYIGLTDNTKEIRKYFENKNKIVCAYFKTWPCKNKTEARKILKEFENFDFIICKKTPNSTIFVFLPIDKNIYKSWKILNTQKPKSIFYIKIKQIFYSSFHFKKPNIIERISIIALQSKAKTFLQKVSRSQGTCKSKKKK